MEKLTQKELRRMVYVGAAIDVTDATSRKEIPEPYTQIGYSQGVYGCNGMLLRGDHTRKLYAVCRRTSAIYLF